MPIPYWTGHYIGLPFKEHGRNDLGLDCWGLVRMVMSDQFNIALPSFETSYRHTLDRDNISKIIDDETQRWKPITPGHEKLADVIVMRVRGQPMHVGMVMGDGHMLHIEYGINSALERYNGPRWKERVAGFYRYISFTHDDITKNNACSA